MVYLTVHLLLGVNLPLVPHYPLSEERLSRNATLLREPPAYLQHLLGDELRLAAVRVARATADGAGAAPVRRVRLFRVDLDLLQGELPQDRVLPVVVERRGRALGGAGADRERHEVRPLGDGVHERSVGRVREEHAREEALVVHVVEADLRLDRLPAGLRRPRVALRRALQTRGRGLPLAVGVLGHLHEEGFQHSHGLWLLAPVSRGQLAVDVVRGEDRAVRVGEANALDELLHLLLVHALRVGEQPDREARVRVQVVDVDLGVLVHHEPEADRRRHLLARGQGDEAGARRMVIKRELAVHGVDLRALDGSVERNAVSGKVREIDNLTEHEIDTRHFFLLSETPADKPTHG